METTFYEDPKIGKMFRRLEEFLDNEVFVNGVTNTAMINAETGRVFAVVLTPQQRADDVAREKALVSDLADALATIATLEDDNVLLDLIDAQNELLQSLFRAEKVEEAEACAHREEDRSDGVRGTVEAFEHTRFTTTPEVENFQNGEPGIEECDSSSEYNREDLQRRISNQRKQINLVQRQKDDAEDRATQWMVRCIAAWATLENYGIDLPTVEEI